MKFDMQVGQPSVYKVFHNYGTVVLCTFNFLDAIWVFVFAHYRYVTVLKFS